MNKDMSNAPAGAIADAPDGTPRLNGEGVDAQITRAMEQAENDGWSVYWCALSSAEDEIAALRYRIRELEAEREWKPIETAPKDGTRILGAYRDGDGWIHLETFYVDDSDNGVIGWFVQGYAQGEQCGDLIPSYWAALPPTQPTKEEK